MSNRVSRSEWKWLIDNWEPLTAEAGFRRRDDGFPCRFEGEEFNGYALLGVRMLRIVVKNPRAINAISGNCKKRERTHCGCQAEMHIADMKREIENVRAKLDRTSDPAERGKLNDLIARMEISVRASQYRLAKEREYHRNYRRKYRERMKATQTEDHNDLCNRL